MGGSVLGMQAIEVKPPASAAAVPVSIVFATRLAAVDVHVDQTGRDDLAGGVEDRLAALGRHVVGGDAAAVDQEVGHAVHLLAGIDDATVLDQELWHGSEISN
jgi:hypothetical protein